MKPQITFSSHQHAITRGAMEQLQKLNYQPDLLLTRHFACDWQELEAEDIKTNRYALENGLRVMSAYTIQHIRFWIITEADRSVTTILLPSEY